MAIHAVHRNVHDAPRTLALVVGQSIVHDVHSVRFFTGDEIVAVSASGSGAIDGSFRHVYVLCALASGAHAVLEFDDRAFAYEVTVEVVAERGDALTGSPTQAVRRRDGSVTTHVGADWFGRFDEAYRVQDQAWIDSIRRGEATGPTANDGLRAQIVVEAILRSLRTGEIVSVPGST
jgi:myo-inositol 2-dehydrogenase/D-chiro-inositol 1-dehydrogenase